MSIKHKGYDRKSFIILPIVFLIIGFLLIFFVVKPIVAPFLEYADLILLDSEMDYDKEFDDIFVPIVDIEEPLPPDDKEDPDVNAEPPDVNVEPPPTQPDTIPLSSITYPKFGTKYAQIRIPECYISTYLYFGDSTKILKLGAGQSTSSFIPGYGGTILAGAHNNTYFHNFKYIKEGQKIYIDTSYGQYVYTVTETKIIKSSQTKELRLDSDKEILVLYTCYPFDELGLTNKRFVVYADYTSGPIIDHSA